MKKLFLISLILVGCTKRHNYIPGDVVHHKLYVTNLLVLDTITIQGNKEYILQFVNEDGRRDTIHAKEIEIED